MYRLPRDLGNISASDLLSVLGFRLGISAAGKHDVGALLCAVEGTADELLERFRRNHDRMDWKEASIRVDTSQFYPDMAANALRRLRHRGADHGLDGSDKEDSDEEDGVFEEESEESDEEENDKDFEDDDKDVEEGIPELVGSEEGDDDRDFDDYGKCN